MILILFSCKENTPEIATITIINNNSIKDTIGIYDFEYDITEAEATWFKSIEVLKGLTFIDSEHYISDAMKAGKTVLAEGAQGYWLG